MNLNFRTDREDMIPSEAKYLIEEGGSIFSMLFTSEFGLNKKQADAIINKLKGMNKNVKIKVENQKKREKITLNMLEVFQKW